MRVTDASAYAALNKRLSAARNDVATAQDRASSGLKVAKPSDDPVAYAAARRENNKKMLADAGVRATELANTQLVGADEALGTGTDAIARAKEIALQGGSEAMGPDQRRDLALQVRQIHDQMVALANTEVAGSFVFGGYRDETAPFDAAGQYTGSAAGKEVSAYPGLKAAASLPGTEAFGTSAGDNVFSTLEMLAQALENNDTTTTRAMIGNLDNDEKRIITARSRLGSMMDGVETAGAVADRYSFSAQSEAARLTQVDEISAVTDLLKAKGALDAALAVAQQMPTGGLVKQRS
jgi:flagellar hook-associated protein 3 FlgL